MVNLFGQEDLSDLTWKRLQRLEEADMKRKVSRAVRVQCEYRRKYFVFLTRFDPLISDCSFDFGIPWKGWRDQVDQVCCKSVGSSSHRKKTVRIWTDSSFLPTTFNFWTDKSVPLGRPLRRYQARAWARALPETFAWNDIRSVVSTGGRADAAAALKAAEEARDAEQKARRKCPLMSATFWEHRIVVQTWVKLESTFQAWAAARAAETAAQRLAGTLLYGFGASGCAVRPQVAHLSRWPRLIRHLIWEWWAAQLFYWSCIRKLAMVQYSVMCESVWCWNV